MTEEQFGRIFELWKKCEKHGLTTAQMFHISEIIRSNANPDTAISAYEEAISDGSLPRTTGTPTKIVLFSNGVCYGPCPESDDERIQKVTVSSTGKVYITLKNYEGKTLRRIQTMISPEKAVAWINNVNTHLSVLIDLMMITDVGSWNIEIVNEQKKKYCSSGYLIEGDSWLDKYSDELRELFDMPELYVFNDASYSKTRLCSCEFEYGGKQYYYKTNDKSIHIGDMVMVPVGKSDNPKKVHVVNIESLDEADLPMEFEKIRSIICKVELELPHSDLADMQKLNTEILGEVLDKESSVY